MATTGPYVAKFKKERIQYGELLGQGSFGVVQKGTLDGEKVAIKTLQLGHNRQVDKEAEDELAVMAKLSHRNVLRLIGVVEEDFKKRPQLIFECMGNGSLLDFITTRATSDSTLLSLMYDIACGMSYLHEMGLVHRDLAGRNVLVDDRDRAKVADFGLSRFIDSDETYYYRIEVGKPLPVRWVPKESLPKAAGGHGKFSPKSDVWSFGVTVWEIWTKGSVPYEHLRNNDGVIAAIESGTNPLTHKKPSNCPQKVVALLLKIFQVDPKLRPAFDRLKLDIDDLRSDSVSDLVGQISLDKQQKLKNDGAAADNLAMIKRLKDSKVIKSSKVEAIVSQVIRSNYAAANPFMDKPQSIGCGVNISGPHMHMRMLELVAEKLSAGGKGLDIGSGSGYITSCMGLMVGTNGKVIGVDHMPQLVAKSIENIGKDQPQLLRDGIVQVHVADGRNGYGAEGPYDVIHIGAATPSISKALLQQLKEGGRIVAPVGPKGGHQELKVVDCVDGGRYETKSICGVIFAPLTSKEEQLRR